MERVQDATERYTVHQGKVRRAYERTLTFAEKKAARWPTLLKQAAEELRQIAIKLLPDEVRRLIADAFGREHEKAAQAIEQVRSGTHTINVMNETVHLARDKEDGFVATMRQLDKPSLDQRLGELQQRELREQQKQRQIEKDRTMPHRQRRKDLEIGD